MKGDGKVDFEDFHALMKGTILRGIQEDNLKDAFEVFDSDKDGFITAKELKELFEKLGEPIGIEEAWDMLNSVNSKHEGLIDFIGKHPFIFIFCQNASQYIIILLSIR